MIATDRTGRLRLGIIGMSKDNGHPYSWSAIINGYDREAMASCPFAAIPEYLGRQSFPGAALAGAEVTHIWTQTRQVSEHVARAALIPNVVDRLESMVGRVDAILLARDDAENHLEHAEVFLRAGMPIYIDKPLSLNRRDALRLFEMSRYPGQIFSCTALRYARELMMTAVRRRRTGEVRFIDAIVPKEWNTYAVHVIEPVLASFPEADQVVRYDRSSVNGVTQLSVVWKSGVQSRFTSTGTSGAPIGISVYGRRGALRLVFRDSFSAFKAALADFIAGANDKRGIIPQEATLRIVDLIEMGCCR
jgi:predicted dehydrogenase